MKNEFILNIIATDDGTHIGGRSNGKTIDMSSDTNARMVAKSAPRPQCGGDTPT